MKLGRQMQSVAVLAFILFFSGLTLIFNSDTPDFLKRRNMADLSPRLHPLFATTKTVCFGHFIVDIPASAIVVYGPTDVDYPIEYISGGGGNVSAQVEKLLVGIEKERVFLDKSDLDKFSLFGKVIDGVVPGQKLVFGSKDHVTYSIDSVIPVGPDLFVQHASSVMSTDDSINSLNTVAKLLRLRAEDEIPTEPGACIEGGFVARQPEFARASIGVRLREFPDVHFSIEVVKNQNYLVESSALEPRLKAAESDGGSWYTGIKFFRRGPRELGNWKGSEALARKPAQERSAESHQFVFVSLGALNDPLQPSLDVQLDTGTRGDLLAAVKPSISDDEAIALWDKLITSIRVRPTGHSAGHSISPLAQTPLGEFVDTGLPCPQGGWWQCSDHGEVAGGRRRHIGAGEIMPYAVLAQKTNLFQKLAGQRSTHEIATTWQLVAYDLVKAVENPKTEADTSIIQSDGSQTTGAERGNTAGSQHAGED